MITPTTEIDPLLINSSPQVIEQQNKTNEKVVLAGMAFFTLIETFGLISTINTILFTVTDDNESSYIDQPPFSATQSPIITTFNIVTAIFVLALGLTYSSTTISNPHKMKKIGLATLAGLAGALSATAGIVSPDCYKPTDFTLLSKQPNYANNCSLTIFQNKYFPTCRISSIGTDISPDLIISQTGICTNTTIQHTLEGIFTNSTLIYAIWPSIISPDPNPQNCVSDPWDIRLMVSTTDMWNWYAGFVNRFPTYGSYLFYAYFEQLKLHPPYLPTNITVIPQMIQDFHNGSWKGIIHAQGWGMNLTTFEDLCYVKFDQLPQLFQDCASPELKTYYQNNYDTLIEKSESTMKTCRTTQTIFSGYSLATLPSNLLLSALFLGYSFWRGRNPNTPYHPPVVFKIVDEFPPNPSSV